ncbi:GNAT family N-acetyltransferase [Vibrio alginolyticus]
MNISIDLVSLKDVDALLDFELVNRAWFERHVPPRDPSFYTHQGVKEQIYEFLLLHENNEMYPMIIRTELGEICGRLNVHQVDSNKSSGELGYRMGEEFTSKGIASKAVEKLISYLDAESKLGYLKAIVLVGNEGSSKVLERNGFSKVRNIPKYGALNGEIKDAVEYGRKLP